jgi:Transglutaminase-like superfamily
MHTARRRARLLAGLAVHPLDTWLVLRMAAWRLVLPVLKRRMALSRLVRLMWEGEESPEPRPERQLRIAELTTVVFRSDHRDRPGNCLDRSLVLYRYLSASGADPELLIGMRREEGPLKGHAWVTVKGAPVEESPEPLGDFAQVVAFRGDGEPSAPRA